MVALSAEEVYIQYIKPMPSAERLRLIELTEREMAETPSLPVVMPKRSIMELRGLGAEMWQDIEAQEYVHELREEWDSRP